MNAQGVVVFGSTGRVGSAVVRNALQRGHRVIAVARDPAKVTQQDSRLTVVRGDTTDAHCVAEILLGAQDAAAVVMAVGPNPLQASTLVTTTVRHIVQAMETTAIRRYLGVSGTAQMPATAFGRLTQYAISRFVKATADHQGAYDVIAASTLDYVLAGCPYIKEGPQGDRPRTYREHTGKFHGGYKTITPAQVADFLCTEVDRNHFHRQIVGIW